MDPRKPLAKTATDGAYLRTERGARMKNKTKSISFSGVLVAAFVCFALPARSATPVTLNLDLPTLIDKAAEQPERFAVNVAQRVSSATDGEWQSNGSVSVWTYELRVPSAVSMSFHAARFALPQTAALTVSGSRARVSYRAGDVSRGGLWSRPLVGESLALSVTVPSADAAKVQIILDSVQVGYRGLGGVPSHPYFARRATAKTSTTQLCVENFACHATAANSGPGHATVAVLIGNQFQCTGTLLNDTSGDLAPYILTARHCENGALGGGAPLAADSVTVYWDAVSACGTTLDSIYDGTAPAQGGAQTVVEQQDAWLIKLDQAPLATDAFWSGWDATGAAFTGGYSVHHALGYDQQYVEWYGQSVLTKLSAATLSIGYNSTFWGVVNQLGSVGAGASGGGLFDPDNHLVGSGSLAALQNGENSPGVCPASPPPPPTASSVTAMYTAFSAVFASIADTTSTTGSTTLQTVLDAAGTGKLVIDGAGILPVALSANQLQPTSFDTISLSWSAPGATACTATGGVAGDGWAGAKTASGTMSVANVAGGGVTYSLKCSAPNLTGHAQVNVQWLFIAAQISLNATYSPLALGGTTTLLWGSNVSPCVASGGVAGDGWAGTKATNSGQQNIVVTQLGTITYAVSCGSGVQSASTQTTVTVVPVQVAMTADSTQVRVGSNVFLTWHSPGNNESCSAAGGSPDDHWAQQIALGGSGMAIIVEPNAGTYTYTINCTGGGESASSSVTVVWTNDAPTISINALSPTQPVYTGSLPVTPATDLLWSSNMPQCNLAALGPLGNTSVTLQGQYPNGTAADAQFMAGLYTYQLNCGAYQATTTIQWTTSTPTLTITAPTTTWVANQSYQVWWTTNTQPCTQTGGVAGDGWAGNAQGGQAAETVTESQPGAYTFTLTCGIGSSMGQAQLTVTVPPPAVSISASTNTTSVGGVINLTWNSTVAPCTTVDTMGGVNWGGSNISPASTVPVFETAAGTFTYAINCGTGSQAVRAATSVTVVPASSTTIAASATSAAVQTPIVLTWNSAGSANCSAIGGNGADGWNGTMGPMGTATVTSTSAGVYSYGVNCTYGSAQTQVTFTAPAGGLAGPPTPSVTLTADTTSLSIDQKATLSWTATSSSSCTASGGSPGDGWNGSLALTGSMAITEATAGSYTFAITCAGAPPAAQAEVSIAFARPTGGGSGGGGGGGGGEFDETSLLLLGVLAAVRAGRRCKQGAR
jgi:hypothetical protein